MFVSHSSHPQAFHTSVAYVAFQTNADCVSEVRKHVSSFLVEDSVSAFIIGCRCDRHGNVKSLLRLFSSFLPRCMECSRGIAVRFLSVCPSVKRVHCDKAVESYV